MSNLKGANLREANLHSADLTRAILVDTDLGRASLRLANLDSAIFQPAIEGLDTLRDIEFSTRLSRLTFKDSPVPLTLLREKFAKAGLRSEERQITFAKLRSQQVQEWESVSLRAKVEAAFSFVAFDLTCAYGLDYGRPLRSLGLLIPLFALVYTCALRGRGRGAVWRIWQPDRIKKEDGRVEPERLSWESLQGGRPRWLPLRLCRAFGLALLFSLVSAFQIGWREFNVGNWITRLQPREYTLRGTGWVRVVSGAQSLLSVYLLALWALTYFGRPFE
jgi:hypothetical protein